MNSIKVLSIDWDYFVDCPIDFKMKNFPDGGNENLPEFVLDQIWMTRYGQCSELKDVKTDTSELLKLRMLLKHAINQNTMVVIADSHKDIYVYLKELRRSRIPVELYNIDFHHDVYDLQSANVDCGNWLRMFAREGDDRDIITWVRREDSDLSGNETLDGCSIVGIPQSITAPLQLVFLCRSGVWSPPHLDKEFLSICRFINKLSDKTSVVDPKVTRNRYNRQFKDNVKQYAGIVNKIVGKHESYNQD